MIYRLFTDIGGPFVANHLTPSELADELQMQQQEVIGAAVAMGVPIFHGRIDKTLFEISLRSVAPERAEQIDSVTHH